MRDKATLVLGVENINEELPLVDGDSLALVELVMDLEDAYGIDLSEAEVAGAGTVGGLVDLVLAKSG